MLFLASGVWAQGSTSTIVDTIELRGLTRISESLVRSQLESKEGEPLSRRAVARDIRRLFSMGHFSNIDAIEEERVGTFVLVYKFTEERTISELIIVGNKKLKSRDVRSALSYQEGDPFLEETFETERADLLAVYKDKGFLNASVDIVVEELDEARMRVTYLITEGRKARIKKVKFTGNENISTRKLRKAVKTGNGFLFISGRYKEEKLTKDLARILEKYGEVGRLESEVLGTNFNYIRDGKRVIITINLLEGAEYTVANLELGDNFVFSDAELNELLEVKPGEIHNATQVREDTQSISEQYHDNGYVNMRIDDVVTLNRSNHTTNITYQIREDDLRYIKEVIITGNANTKDEVARRHIIPTPGDRYDGADLRRSVNDMQRSQMFGDIRPSSPNYPGDDRFMNLLIDVDEGRTGNFNFGAGVNSDTGIGGFGELRLNNFDITNPPKFNGGGQVFNATANIGDYNTSYRIGFTDPEILGYPLSFGVDFFDDEFQSRGASDFIINQQGARIRLGKRLSKNVTLRTFVGVSNTDIEDLETFVDPFLRELEDDGTTYTWGWSYVRNTSNHYLDPTDGTRIQVGMEYAGFGGDNEFFKTESDLTFYYGFKKLDKYTFSFNNRIGYALPLGDKELVPLSSRFFAGGGTTIRGYENRDVGPRAKTYGSFEGDQFFDTEAIGGEFRILNTVEAKYKVNDIMRVYTFMDGGGVWMDIGDFDFQDMKYSVGVGVGMQVPFLGPLRVDYGFPLNPDDHQGSGRLHLQSLINF